MVDHDNFGQKDRRHRVGLTYNPKDNRFVLTFNPDASKRELLEEWDRFEKARKGITGKTYRRKTKEPSDIQLLLGIKFLRFYGITFKLIHKAYLDKQVPYYSGNYRFLTEFDLQKYYNRNINKI